MPADLPPERIQPGSAGPFPVPCAGGFVEDSFGVSVVLNVGSVHQVFRWIAPGRFRMGSPADEAERGSAEVLHEVTLSKGYWLADTACTQAFWLAVWPVNPSHFQEDPHNPVENVAWHDAQRFIAELNRRLPGLHARLPARPNGNTPAVPAPRRRFRLASRLLPNRSTTTATTPTRRREGPAIASGQLRSARCHRTPGDCTRCTATSGNGAPTGTPSTRRATDRPARPGFRQDAGFARRHLERPRPLRALGHPQPDRTRLPAAQHRFPDCAGAALSAIARPDAPGCTTFPRLIGRRRSLGRHLLPERRQRAFLLTGALQVA
jgi:hypothetical protein